MKTIYTTAFDIKSGPMTGETLLECADNEIFAWVQSKYRRSWNLDLQWPEPNSSLAPLAGHTIGFEVAKADGAEIREYEWTHPGVDSDTIWTTVINLACVEEKVNCYISVKISSSRFVLKPLTFDFGRPRIVSQLIEGYDCSVDGWQVPRNWEELTGGQIEDFIDDRLLSPERNLPIVMISTDSWLGRSLVNPKTFHDSLKGLAEVVLIDKWAGFHLTDAFGKELSCFEGAVRIYWPNFQPEDNPFAHKLFLPAEILRRADEPVPLDKFIFRYLCAIGVTRHVDGRVYAEAKDRLNRVARQRTEVMREDLAKHGTENEGLRALCEEALDANERLRKENDTLKARIEDVEHIQVDYEAQKAAWSQFQEYAPIQERQDTSSVETPTRREFKDVLDAYDQAATEFGAENSVLIFMPSARETAEDSPYQNADHLYEFFKALHRLADKWSSSKGKMGKGWRQALQECGFDYKDNISDTSSGKYGDEYKFTYRGQRIPFHKHVTLGAKQPQKCLSVHWHLDDQNWKLVIGHCGRHLSNTTT